MPDILEQLGAHTSATGGSWPYAFDAVGVHTRITARPRLLTSEVVGVRGSAHAAVRALVADTFATRTDSFGHGFTSALESVAAHAVSAAYATHHRQAADSFGTRSRSYVRIAQTAADVAGVSEVVTHTVVLRAREQVGVRDVVVIAHSAKVVLREFVGVRSRVRGALYEFAADLVGARSGSSVSNVIARQRMLEQFGVSASAIARVIPVARIRERIGAHTWELSKANVVATRRERFFAYARSWAPFVPVVRSFEEGADVTAHTSVWTADMRSWGMSRYVGVPVSEFAAHPEGVFGAAPSGVYFQEGAAPVSWIETAKVSFEDQFDARREKKRLSNVYTYAVHDQPLNVAVSGDFEGVLTTYVYAQPTAAADSTRAVRCGVGRGFASNFYQFKIGDSAFDMYHFEVELAKLQRRV